MLLNYESHVYSCKNKEKNSCYFLSKHWNLFIYLPGLVEKQVNEQQYKLVNKMSSNGFVTPLPQQGVQYLLTCQRSLQEMVNII